MRKNLINSLVALTLAVATFSCSSTSSKEPGGLTVEEKNYPLVFDFTATWCGPCGQNGTPMFKRIASELEKDASFMAVHSTSSELVAHLANGSFSPAVWGMNALLGLNISAIPSFTVNGSLVQTNETTIKSAITTASQRVVEAGVNFTASKNANGIDINYATKFFAEVDGDYYLGFYLTEDEVMHRQYVGAAYQSNYEHSKILRAIMNPEVIEKLSLRNSQGQQFTVDASFGQSLVSGSIEKGKTKTGSVKFVYDAAKFDISSTNKAVNPFVWSVNNKYKVVAVIWRKSAADRYVFVNSKTVKLY
jgi:thiol-disulfide isomerase/thioredoxin